MLDYLGMRVRQECCEFRSCRARGTPLERTSQYEWAAWGVCSGGVAVAATHPVLKQTAMLDYLGMSVEQECCGFEGL
jgi:hypothetical protein